MFAKGDVLTLHHSLCPSRTHFCTHDFGKTMVAQLNFSTRSIAADSFNVEQAVEQQTSLKYNIFSLI